MAILGRSRPNVPIVLDGDGVQVAGTQALVVSQPPPRPARVYNKGTLARTPDGVASPGTVAVATRPVDRRFLRVNPNLVGQGVGGFEVAPALVVTRSTPKVLAPRPIVFSTPFEAPVVPESPAPQPIVRPGPYPHRTTKGPIIISATEGVPPSPVVVDIDWCPGTPFTGWAAGTPFTDWEADTSVTSWTAFSPVEDC